MSERDEVESLRAENAELRARLGAREEDDRRARDRAKWVASRGGRLLIPLIDKQKVARNFVALFRVVSHFAGPREGWPKREDVTAAAEAFALSLLRLFIRRRLFVLLMSLVALAMPGMQVWLLVQQNHYIDLQNQLIEIQADDILSRGVTSGELAINQINGALLSGRDVRDLSRMLRRIFGANNGSAPGATMDAPEVRAQYLKGTAARAHLLLALGEAIRDPGGETPPSPGEMWKTLVAPRTGALPALMKDAQERLVVTLRSPKAAFTEEKHLNLERECERYVVGLSDVATKAWSLAVAVGEREEFFALLGPVLAKVSSIDPRGDGPMIPVFRQLFRELLLDVALEPRYGDPEPPLPSNVEATISQGFARLQEGVGGGARVKWPVLKALLDVK